MDFDMSNGKIAEIALNPQFYSDDDLKMLENKGFKTRYLSNNEVNKKIIKEVIVVKTG